MKDSTGNEALPHEPSEASASPLNDKDDTPQEETSHIENIRTISRVPGNDHYHEKNGLRTYGDDEDHNHEPPVSIIDNDAGGFNFKRKVH